MFSNTLIIVETKSNRVLRCKLKSKVDLALATDELLSFTIQTPRPIELPTPFTTAYAPETGFRQLAAPSESELPSLMILQRKADALITLKMTVDLAREDMLRTHTDEALLIVAISDQNFKIYWQMMREEKAICLTIAESVYQKRAAKILLAQSLDEINAAHRWMAENMDLGIDSMRLREAK